MGKLSPCQPLLVSPRPPVAAPCSRGCPNPLLLLSGAFRPPRLQGILTQLPSLSVLEPPQSELLDLGLESVQFLDLSSLDMQGTPPSNSSSFPTPSWGSPCPRPWISHHWICKEPHPQTAALFLRHLGVRPVRGHGSLIIGYARNPTLKQQLFSYAILGFALSEAMGLFCLMMAFLLLFAF